MCSKHYEVSSKYPITHFTLTAYSLLPTAYGITVYIMEPTTGIEPVNLILTKDVLYLLSYVGIKIECLK
jgi:hypothetical protein